MSGSQKFINVIGILDIIFGALGLVLGIISLIGLGSASAAAAIAQAGLEVAVASSMLYGALIVLLISSLFDLILGILCVRAARDATKIGPVFVVAVIDMILTAVGIILGIVTKSFSWTSLFSLILPALVLYAANNIRKQKNEMLGR